MVATDGGAISVRTKGKKRELISAGRKIANSPRNLLQRQQGPAGVPQVPLLPLVSIQPPNVETPTSEWNHEGSTTRKRRTDSPSANSDSSGQDAPQSSPRNHLAGRTSSARLVGDAHTPTVLDTAELSKGGAALIKKLQDVSVNNGEFRKQLERQSREIAALEEGGKIQQRLLKDFERHIEQVKQSEALATEARVRSENAQIESKLRSELDEMRDKVQTNREELLERMRGCDVERGLREGERDEARLQVRELETRLDAMHGAPEEAQARIRALEMEVNLVRSRFAKEVATREAAEREARDAKDFQQRLEAALAKSQAETKHLQRVAAEFAEVNAFRQEVSDDLQVKLLQQREEADRRLSRERGKLEAVNRLEGVLPRGLILKALG